MIQAMERNPLIVRAQQIAQQRRAAAVQLGLPQNRVYIFAPAPSSKIDEPVAYSCAMDLEQQLRSEYPSIDIQRVVGVSHKREASAIVRQDPQSLIMILLDCTDAEIARRGRKTKRAVFPLITSSSFDQSKFPQMLYEYLDTEFGWLRMLNPERSGMVTPMWQIIARQDDYLMVKQGITPVRMALGSYETVADLKTIKSYLPNVRKAICQALDHFLLGTQGPDAA